MNESTKKSELCTQGNDASPPQGRGKPPNADTTIGDLVAATFDEAAHYTADLRRVAHLTTQAVARLLRRARSRSHVTGATQRVLSGGFRLPAFDTPLPVGAQIRVAVYAASLVEFSSAGRPEAAVRLPSCT